MGPKAAGLSRSMGGAVWSPWSWPLSAQARTLLDPHPHPSSHSGDSADALRPTDQPLSAGFPFLRLTAQERGKAGRGGLSTTILGCWGDLYH